MCLYRHVHLPWRIKTHPKKGSGGAHTLIPQSVNNTSFTEKFCVRNECQSGFQHNRHWGVIWYIDGCLANQGTVARVQGLGTRIFQAELHDIKAGGTEYIILSTHTQTYSPKLVFSLKVSSLKLFNAFLTSFINGTCATHATFFNLIALTMPLCRK
jgi:hypothetical protein